MRLRQHIVAMLAGLITAMSLVACFTTDEDTLTVVASATPHGEVLEHVANSGALGNLKIKIKIKSGELDANQLVAAGDADANFFQHVPYLDNWLSQHPGENLIALGEIFVVTQGLYSSKYSKTTDIPDGATIAVPRDVSNYARSLYLLEEAGLIKLDQPRETADLTQVSERSITKNPRHIKLLAIEGAQLARIYDDPKVDAVVITGNFALESGLNAMKDSLAHEEASNSRYINSLAVRKDNVDDRRIKTLVEALTSTETAKWIEEYFKGTVVPLQKVP